MTKCTNGSKWSKPQSSITSTCDSRALVNCPIEDVNNIFPLHCLSSCCSMCHSISLLFLSLVSLILSSHLVCLCVLELFSRLILCILPSQLVCLSILELFSRSILWIASLSGLL